MPGVVLQHCAISALETKARLSTRVTSLEKQPLSHVERPAPKPRDAMRAKEIPRAVLRVEQGTSGLERKNVLFARAAKEKP